MSAVTADRWAALVEVARSVGWSDSVPVTVDLVTAVRAAQWRELGECWPWPRDDGLDREGVRGRPLAPVATEGYSAGADGNMARLVAADRKLFPAEWAADEAGQPSDKASDDFAHIAERSGAGDLCSDVDAPGMQEHHRSARPSGVLGGASCAHSFAPVWWDRYDGPLDFARVCTRLDCERPVLLVCGNGCGTALPTRCGTGRASKCAGCATRKRKDCARICRSGWLDRSGDLCALVTLTAPGADVIGWDRGACTHDESVKCSGKIGCVCDPFELARWHWGIGLRWSHFMRDLRREVGSGVTVEFFKTWEPQDRNALHAHAPMRVSGAITARRFEAAVRLCARRNGFGRQCKVDPLSSHDERGVARAAGYVAKYVTKSADALPDLVSVSADGEMKTGGLRSWSASRGWGLKMCDLAAARRAYACALGGDAGAAGAPLASEASLDPKKDFYPGESAEPWVQAELALV